MNIKEKIYYFADNFSIDFLKTNYIKLDLLEQEIRRYIKRGIKENKLPEISSNDLRHFIINLTKVHKKTNQKIEFANFKKSIFDIKNLTNEAFDKRLNDYIELIIVAGYLQKIYSAVNFLEFNLSFLETKLKNQKEQSDLEFNQEALEVINKFLRNLV